MLRRRKRRRRLPETVVESPFERLQINLLPSRGWKKVRKRRKQKHLSLESDKLRVGETNKYLESDVLRQAVKDRSWGRDSSIVHVTDSTLESDKYRQSVTDLSLKSDKSIVVVTDKTLETDRSRHGIRGNFDVPNRGRPILERLVMRYTTETYPRTITKPTRLRSRKIKILESEVPEETMEQFSVPSKITTEDIPVVKNTAKKVFVMTKTTVRMVPVIPDTIKRTSYVRMPHIGNVNRLSTNTEISTRAETDFNTDTEHSEHSGSTENSEHSGNTEHSSAMKDKRYPLVKVAMYGVASSDTLNHKANIKVSKSDIRHIEISTITTAATVIRTRSTAIRTTTAAKITTTTTTKTTATTTTTTTTTTFIYTPFTTTITTITITSTTTSTTTTKPTIG